MGVDACKFDSKYDNDSKVQEKAIDENEISQNTSTTIDNNNLLNNEYDIESYVASE